MNIGSVIVLKSPFMYIYLSELTLSLEPFIIYLYNIIEYT